MRRINLEQVVGKIKNDLWKNKVYEFFHKKVLTSYTSNQLVEWCQVMQTGPDPEIERELLSRCKVKSWNAAALAPYMNTSRRSVWPEAVDPVLECDIENIVYGFMVSWVNLSGIRAPEKLECYLCKYDFRINWNGYVFSLVCKDVISDEEGEAWKIRWKEVSRG